MASKTLVRKEKANYTRYHNLVIDEAGRVLRKLFEVKALAQAPSVDDFLILAHTRKALAKITPSVITTGQLDLIYPPSGDEVHINTWDITLLSVVLKNTCKLTRQEKLEVDRIRIIRNETCGHVAQTRLSNSEYTSQWADLEDAIKNVLISIGQPHFQTETIDSIKAIEQDNDIDHLAAIVDTWRNAEPRFAETQASRKVQQLLQNNNVVTITGVSGSGKSGIAHHAALILEQEDYTIYPVTEAEDILKHRNTSEKQVFVFDDPIGKHVLELDQMEQFQQYHEDFKTYVGGLNNIQPAASSHVTGYDTKIIITCRKNILNDRNFSNETIIGIVNVRLNENETILTTEEKRAMFSKYAPQAQVTDEDKEDIVQNSYDNFPILCKLFGTDFQKYKGRAKEFFKKPFEFLKTEIANLKWGSPYQFCSLLLCLVFDNSFDVKRLRPSPTLPQTSKEKATIEKIMYICGTEGKGIEVERAFQSLAETGIYFIKEDTRFTFIHDTLVDAVGYQFGQEFPAEMIEICASSFIREYVRTEGVESEHVIRVPKYVYGTLAKRFCSDLKNENFHDVFRNPSFSDNEFLDVFCNYVRNLGQDYVRHLFFETTLRSETLSEENEKLKEHTRNNKEQFTHALLQQKGAKGIHYVMAYNHSEIFDACHSVMGKLASPKNDDINLVLMACLSGNVTMLDKILNDNKTTNIANVGRHLTALHVAAASGNIDMVENVIKRSFDVNIKKLSLYTPLHIAAAHGHVQVVSKLIEHKVNINACSEIEETPIYLAAQNGHTEVVSVLLHNHADANMCTKEHGSSPLHVAASNGHTAVVSILLQNHVNVNKGDKDGRTPLFVAARDGHTGAVSALLQNHADVNECRNGGYSSLYIASQNGHIDVVSILLQNNAEANKCSETGATPLHVAAGNGHTKVVSVLIQHHADASMCTKEYGSSPLYAAASHGHTRVVAILLQNHADVNQCDNGGYSPLYVASENGHIEVVAILLQNHADVNKCGNRGYSPLYIASHKGLTEVVAILLQNHADVNQCDNRGYSPLYVASQSGHTGVVAVLLQNHADVNKREATHDTSPLDAAVVNGHRDIEDMLLEHGADVNIRYRLSTSRYCRWFNGLSRKKKMLILILVSVLMLMLNGLLFLLNQQGLLEPLTLLITMLVVVLVMLGLFAIMWLQGFLKMKRLLLICVLPVIIMLAAVVMYVLQMYG